jgi:hypothetical protein
MNYSQLLIKQHQQAKINTVMYYRRPKRSAEIFFFSIWLLFIFFPVAQAIRWPFWNGDVSLPLGNNYGEYQYYGSYPYMHPGIDILQPAHTPVYAVKSGIVKAVLTTSGDYHWRVAVGDSSGSGWCDGWLYAHLDENTITVQVGDSVEVGDYLGDLVWWPVAGFHHLHFVKIRNQGITWFSDWKFIANPLDELVPIDEPDPPVIENARDGAKFAFCYNNTHAYFDPGTPLSGPIDIVSKIYDRTIHPTWRMIPYQIEYSIYNDSISFGPVLSFIFTDTLYWNQNVDVIYQDDEICNTEGDYDYRDFYFIVTNTDQDSLVEGTDWFLGWDTEEYPNATYWVKVTTSDRFGNSDSDSMQVEVENYFDVVGKVGLSDSPPDSSGTVVSISYLSISDTTEQTGTFHFEDVGGGYYLFEFSHPGYVSIDTVAPVLGNSHFEFNLTVGPYIRGDVNYDQKIDGADVVYFINYLFRKGSIPLPYFSGDANSNGSVDGADIVFLINYLYREGPPPTAQKNSI